jgi:hypothetical protein
LTSDTLTNARRSPMSMPKLLTRTDDAPKGADNVKTERDRRLEDAKKYAEGVLKRGFTWHPGPVVLDRLVRRHHGN